MAVVANVETRIEALLERITMLERENKILRDEVALLKQGRYGRSSERLDAAQLAFFLGEPTATSAPVQAEPTVEQSNSGKKKGHGRAPFAASLPRRIIELDVPEGERHCSCCGKELHLIGEDVTERGHKIPAQIVVNRYVRKKYACPDGHIVKTAEAPEGVIAGAKWEPSMYAWVAVSKYGDHLPLHRLEGMLKREGVHLPKQTMWDMLVRLDEIVAQPVLRQMRTELLEEGVLHADETPVVFRVEDGKGSKQGYAFGWRSLAEAEEQKVLTEYRTSRGRDGPAGFLGKWSGTLIIDGYSGYDEVVKNNHIVRAGCWSHARRKLKAALDTGAREAASVLVHVQRLFWLERAINERSARLELSRAAREELRAQVRERRSRIVIERIYAVAGELAGRRSTLPKSELGKALGYLDRQYQPLTVFLGDARIPIHNNDAERDLRHLAIGRNNWLVFGSEKGGDVACRLYSLVLSCRQAGIDPTPYIEDLLTKVSTTPATEIATLTPWAWARARKQAPAEPA